MSYPQIYAIDFSLQAERNLPPKYRKPKWLAFYTALMKPLQWLRDTWINSYRPALIEKAKYTGQTIVLEYIINKLHTPGTNPSYIDNIDNNIDPVVFYNEAEGYPGVVFYNEAEAQPGVVFYNEAEFNPAEDFTLYVHNTRIGTAAQIAANTQSTAQKDKKRQIEAELAKYAVAGVVYTVKPYPI